MIITKTLHSGEFLDYEGNIIRVTFTKDTELELFFSQYTVDVGKDGGEFIIETYINNAGDYSFISSVTGNAFRWGVSFSSMFNDEYVNADGFTVHKYKLTIPQNTTGKARESKGEVGLTYNYNGSELKKTITIKQSS
jgi:hypothetical protein